MDLHRGRQSVVFPNLPVIGEAAAVAGKKEAEGPLGRYFDLRAKDTRLRQRSWEQAESRMQRLALQLLCKKTRSDYSEIGAVFSGDLLNQCIGSSFTLRSTGIPALGLYGACSTMAEALLLSAAAVNAGYAERAVALTSSHFASAERQYRFPLGYGGQRTPTAQWTVTGAGAAMVCREGAGPALDSATVGTGEDKGVTDANNMGAAMAYAAYRTLRAHFDDLGRAPEDYDLIVTGDLGLIGKQLVDSLFQDDGVQLGERYRDCGLMIYDRERQDAHCGGSGCACSALVLCGPLLRQLRQGKLRSLLFCGTGALLSPLSVQQGESIPAVCHAVALRATA